MALRWKRTIPSFAEQPIRSSPPPILIPHKPPERFVPAGPEEAAYEPPAKLKYLALFALEMEARGFEIEPDYG